jgi:outer membrane protein OmpA-like peptidoglycan-associated protein/outer membrane protein W
MFKKLKRTLALAALMAGGSAVANQAQATEGWYGRVDAGYSVGGSLDEDIELTIGDNSASQSTDLDFDNNWMASGGVGYAFSNGFRLEGELAYRNNDFEDSDTEVTAKSAMLNLYYDFNRGGRLEPYVGVGVGYANVDPDIAFHEDDSGFAYQALAGVAIGLTERLDLDIGYRYFRVDDLDFGGTTIPDILDDDLVFKFGGDYIHQAVTVGLRWQFAAAEAPPPPPPPPPPAPVVTCPQSDFVVYFEWDRSNLNAQALEVIDAAVQRARECNVSTATVIGHTDTSGSTQYNIGLSERRASVVRDAMVARGLAASLITTQARGESDLARATPDGTREPLNRRTAVTIVFQ